MVRLLLVIAGLLLAGGIATAQPSQPAPASDAQAQFDAAFAAMTRGDFANAAVMFRAVASSTSDPELRGAATQLGRLADDFARRGGRISFSGSPSFEAPGQAAPGQPASSPPTRADASIGVSEDDQADGGRATFIVWTTMGALYTGVVLIDVMDIDDVRSGTVLVMGATAAGLVGSLFGTRGRTMTGGMAEAWSTGLLAGAGNALLLAAPLGLYDADTNASEKVQSLVLGSAWGLATAGLLVAEHFRPTRAQVSVTTTAGLMGIASTLLTLGIIQPNDTDGNAFLAITAGGLDAGLAAGALLSRDIDWSLSRARLVGLSAFLGGLAGVGTSLLLFADIDDTNDNGDNALRLAAGITLGGLWGGAALGTYLTREMQPDYRFRVRAAAPAGATAQIAPAMIRNAPGLALVGAF